MSSYYIIDMRAIGNECAELASSALLDAGAWLDLVEIAMSYDPFAPHASYQHEFWMWVGNREIPNIQLAQLAFETITETSISYVLSKIQDRIDVESSWSRAEWIRPGLLKLELV